MKRIFYGKAEKGKLIMADQQGFNMQICLLEGKEVVVTLAKKTKQRSLNQNKYLWGICYALISDSTGMTADEVHDAMRIKFLLDRSKKLITITSTSELDTVTFEDYLSKIRQWASEFLSIYIPLPNECEV